MKGAWQRISAEPAVATGAIVASINVVAAFGVWMPTPEQLAAINSALAAIFALLVRATVHHKHGTPVRFAGPGRAGRASRPARRASRPASRASAKPNPCRSGAHSRGPDSPGRECDHATWASARAETGPQCPRPWPAQTSPPKQCLPGLHWADPAVTHLDTWRDKNETARQAAFPQRGGPFSLVVAGVGFRADGLAYLLLSVASAVPGLDRPCLRYPRHRYRLPGPGATRETAWP